MRECADIADISEDELLSHRRFRQHVFGRHIALYLSCMRTNLTIAKIGQLFGQRDHTTVIHARNAVLTQLRLPFDNAYKDAMNIINSRLPF